MISLREYVRVYDGCVKAMYVPKAGGARVTQRKRRRKGAEDTSICTWHRTVHCDDHPIRCPQCGAGHAHLRINASINCDCGRTINRMEQLAIYSQRPR